jgi:hypothetical protein
VNIAHLHLRQVRILFRFRTVDIHQIVIVSYVNDITLALIRELATTIATPTSITAYRFYDVS